MFKNVYIELVTSTFKYDSNPTRLNVGTPLSYIVNFFLINSKSNALFLGVFIFLYANLGIKAEN